MLGYIFRFVFSNGFLLLLGLFLRFGSRHVPFIQDYSVTNERIASFIFLVLFLNSIAFLFSYFYRKKNKIPYPKQDTVIVGVRNVYLTIVSLATILLIASFFGISFKDLITSLSIVAAAIAIISKEFISAIISGFILAFSKMLNIDDYVQIGSYKGRIIDMTLTKIHLLNEDDDLIIIGNDKVFYNEIINYSKGNLKRVSIPFSMDNKYISSVEDLESSLIREMHVFFDKIDQQSFNLRVSAVHKDYIDFKFQYTLKEIDKSTEFAIRRKTARKVINYIKEQSKKID